jgi:branched-chain amino acid transport system substrate-binding protein
MNRILQEMLNVIARHLTTALALTIPMAMASAEPYRIPTILPLTGTGAFIGQAEQATLEMIKKVVNGTGGIKGQPVDFQFFDDQTNPQTGVQLLNDIQQSKPQVILGSSLVAVCSAMSPLLASGPVDYCLSPAIHPQPGSYVFSSSESTTDLYAINVRFFRLKGWRRIATIATTDASGQDGEKGIAAAMARPENHDVTLVAQARFNPSDVSIAAQMAGIAAAKPDAIILLASGTPAATVFKGLIEAGLDLPVGSATSNATHPQMSGYKAFLPKQLYFPTGQWPREASGFAFSPKVAAARERFYKAFDEAKIKPDTGSTLAWDPAWIVLDALKALGTGAQADQIRDYIQHISDYGGINGIYDFAKVPQRGLSEDDIIIMRWLPEKDDWGIVTQAGGRPMTK